MTIKSAVVALAALAGQLAHAQYVILTGNLQVSNGLPASNYSISFTPSQYGFIAGTAVVLNTTTFCATSTDGSVVGLPNPLLPPVVSTSYTGTLPPGNYFTVVSYYDAAGNTTLASPEQVHPLSATGRLMIAPPVGGWPSGAAGMRVYIAQTPGAETLQGSTVGPIAYIQSVPLTPGANPSTVNTTICKQVATDTIWPLGTGYVVSLADPHGNTSPGYPMQWQLNGANTTINLSNGLPYYHGTVFFPTPILAAPVNHNLQTISGNLGLSGYNLLNVGKVGIGTNLPAWPLDVENGFVNSNAGYLVNGTAGTTGQCLMSGGTNGPDTWGACSTAATLFYQNIDVNQAPLPQRQTLNFAPRFSVSDISGQTNVDFEFWGSPGTYTYPTSITTDSYGRVSGVTTGTASGRNCGANGCTRVNPDGTMEQWGVVTISATGSTVANVNITFPTAFTSPPTLTVSGGSQPDGNDDAYTVYHKGLTTTGATAVVRCSVNIGGSGCGSLNAVPVHWFAIGN